MGFDMMAPAPQIRADFEAIRDPDVGWEGIYRDPSFLSEEYNPNYGPDPYHFVIILNSGELTKASFGN